MSNHQCNQIHHIDRTEEPKLRQVWVSPTVLLRKSCCTSSFPHFWMSSECKRAKEVLRGFLAIPERGLIATIEGEGLRSRNDQPSSRSVGSGPPGRLNFARFGVRVFLHLSRVTTCDAPALETRFLCWERVYLAQTCAHIITFFQCERTDNSHRSYSKI